MTPWVIIYLSLAGPHADTGQGVLGCRAVGPFETPEAAEEWERTARSMEGPGYIRPLVPSANLVERWSAD